MSKATITELVKTLTALALSNDDGERQRLTDVLRKLNEQLTAHVRKLAYVTENNAVNVSYEIRYRKSGLDVTATAKTLAQAKHKFIHKLFCIYCIKGANNNE